MSWTLIESGHQNAYDNMGTDEAVFMTSLEAMSAPPVLRLYGWRPAAISIGCFQRAQDLEAERQARGGIDLVRRATGGSAILHHEELTYSLCMPFGRRADRRATEMLYIAAHKAVLRGLEELGVRARMRGDSETPCSPDSPFCFAQHTKFDIMVGERKLVGSAQRRKGSVILQHGSIPIADAHGAPHAICLAEAAGRSLTFEEVAEAVRRGFETQFRTRLDARPLSEREHALARRLAAHKYRTDRWTFRR